MKWLRQFFQKHERKFLIALVIFLLAIFTVVPEMTSALAPAQQGPGDDEIAGEFDMPYGKVEVTYGEYSNAQREYEWMAGARGETVTPAEVWRYLILREGARHQSIRISDSELRDILTRIGPWGTDAALYRRVIESRYRVAPAVFEQAVRNFFAVQRLQQVYRVTYQVAPPAKRQALVEQAQSRLLEYARTDYAVLPAGNYLEPAEMAFRAKPEEEREKELESFYGKDQSVRMSGRRFEHPYRYDVEFLYTVHRNLDEESFRKIEGLFARAYPGFELSELEETEEEMRRYFDLYRDRLLDRIGSSWKEVKRKATEEYRKDKAEDGESGDGGDGEGEESGEDGDDADPIGEITPELRKAWQNHGFTLVQEIIDRELRVRSMYRVWRAEIDESKDVAGMFEKLREADLEEEPITATEPGEGLVVYRTFDEPLSGDEIEDLEDSGVRFTHNVRSRVTQIGSSGLPKLHRHADTMGMAGHGRMIIRLNKVDPRRRKTFAELTEGERKDLVEQFFVPAKAREMAEQELEKLRKACVEGSLDDAAFAEKAALLGCRVRRDEWITATDEVPDPPSAERFWPTELVHMRDRRFLVGALRKAFAADRGDKKLKAGSYLEVMVDRPIDIETDETEKAGAAFLVLLKERRPADAKTLPRSDLETWVSLKRNERGAEQRARWNEEYKSLFTDFNLECRGPMKERLQRDLEQREEKAKRNTRGPLG